ncbi:MAG: ascD [Frankiales bacterium]|nr:ascD [Frankiales bacterium]
MRHEEGAPRAPSLSDQEQAGKEEPVSDKHVVRFEPVGIEIEVDESQTVLRAAAEQGIMLMHGCKEGQCSACKSFVLEGEDIELERYSTFALPDYEKEEGYTLLCRAHVYEDVQIELLNYDEDMIRSGLPINDAVAEVVSITPVTHDMRRLVLRLVAPTEVAFFPGQYMDIAVPGTDVTRSFSMANTSSRTSGLMEFVIKVYPDGVFSSFLDTRLAVGERLDIVGPFGVFTLRESRDCDIVFLGGGAGMAPILSLIRSMVEQSSTRKATFYYGARGKRDLCFEDELRSLEKDLPDFHYVPALSEPDPADSWDGEVGLITDVLRRHEKDLSGVDAYVCGPPPMVEAAIPALEQLGVEEKRIYFDKFTTTGSSDPAPVTGRATP